MILSALDFLDAPNRMSRFLDGTMIRLLMAPSRAGFKFASAGFLLFSRIVSKILGGQLLRDISAFVAALAAADPCDRAAPAPA